MYAQCSLQADRKGGRIKSWILWPHQRKLSWEGGGTSWYPPLGGNTGIVGTKPNVTSLEIPWCSKGVPLEKSTHPLVFAQFPQMSTHQSCKIMLATCEYCVGTENTEHSCKFHLLFRLRNWPSCEPEASRNQHFHYCRAYWRLYKVLATIKNLAECSYCTPETTLPSFNLRNSKPHLLGEICRC